MSTFSKHKLLFERRGPRSAGSHYYEANVRERQDLLPTAANPIPVHGTFHHSFRPEISSVQNRHNRSSLHRWRFGNTTGRPYNQTYTLG